MSRSFFSGIGRLYCLSRIHLLLIMLMVCLTACQKKRNTAPPIESGNAILAGSVEYLDQSTLILTASIASPPAPPLTQFTPGIMDIVFYIRSDSQYYVHSLNNRENHFRSDSTTKQPDLSRLGNQTRLYLDTVNVPSGQLEKVEIIYSGSRSLIATKEGNLSTVNGFYHYLSQEKPAYRHLQTEFPLHVETILPEPEPLPANSVRVLNLMFHPTLSVSEDPVQSSDNLKSRGKYPTEAAALFSPVVTVSILSPESADIDAIPFAFSQFQYINMGLGGEDSNVFAAGNQQETTFITDYRLSQDLKPTLDGDPLEDITSIEGLYFSMLSGKMTINDEGYLFILHQADFFSPAQNHTLFTGTITEIGPDKLAYTANESTLNPNSQSRQVGQVKREIHGRFSTDNLHKIITGLTDKTTETHRIIKVGNTVPQASDLVLALRASTAIPPRKMLDLGRLQETQETHYLTLDDINLNAFIQPVNTGTTSSIHTLSFNKEEAGHFIIMQARRGQLEPDDTQEANDTRIHGRLINTPMKVSEFKKLPNFLRSLKAMTESGDRLVTLIATGKRENDVFKVEDYAGAVLLMNQPDIDNGMDEITSLASQTDNSEHRHPLFRYTQPSHFSITESDSFLTYLHEKNLGVQDVYQPLKQRHAGKAVMTYSSGIGVTTTPLAKRTTIPSTEPGIAIYRDAARIQDTDTASTDTRTSQRQPLQSHDSRILEGAYPILKGETNAKIITDFLPATLNRMISPSEKLEGARVLTLANSVQESFRGENLMPHVAQSPFLQALPSNTRAIAIALKESLVTQQQANDNNASRPLPDLPTGNTQTKSSQPSASANTGNTNTLAKPETPKKPALFVLELKAVLKERDTAESPTAIRKVVDSIRKRHSTHPDALVRKPDIAPKPDVSSRIFANPADLSTDASNKARTDASRLKPAGKK